MLTSLRFAVAFASVFTVVTTIESAEAGLLPAPPSALEATEQQFGVQLEWAPSAGERIVGYNIYRSVVSTNADPAARINAEPVSGTELAAR